MEEPAEIRIGRGQRLSEAVREDLELYGVAELEERIDVLRAENEALKARLAAVEAALESRVSGVTTE